MIELFSTQFGTAAAVNVHLNYCLRDNIGRRKQQQYNVDDDDDDDDVMVSHLITVKNRLVARVATVIRRLISIFIDRN